MIKKTAPYSHSLIQIEVIMPADPNKPVMIRWVRLLYFEIGDFTKSYVNVVKQKVNMTDQKFVSEVVDNASKYNTVALLLGLHSRLRIEAEQQNCLPR